MRTRSCAPRRAFTLVELLVVIAIIALLIGILLPTLGAARRASQRVACLANLRSLETAHTLFAADHGGAMLGTSHGVSWHETLLAYDPNLLMRSPVDRSTHFEEGEPVDGVYRVTSYSLNYELSPDNTAAPARVELVTRPFAVAHFVLAAFEGPGAVRDHVHPRTWDSPIRTLVIGKAGREIQLNAYSGNATQPGATSGYSYLDGHAESNSFAEVYTDAENNRFVPFTQ